MCVCVCVCVCVYVCVYIYIYIYIYMRVNPYGFICRTKCNIIWRGLTRYDRAIIIIIIIIYYTYI